MKSYLIVQPVGGLCNRMRAIAGTVELAKVLHKKPLVLWTRDVSLNARFFDLFSDVPFKVLDLELNSLYYKFLKLYLRLACGYKVVSDDWIYPNTRNKSMDSWVDFFYNKKVILNTCLDIIPTSDYGYFKINSKLLETQSDWPENVIGIHIRRQDNIQSIKNSPTSLFVRKMKEMLEHNPMSHFYLATDDEQEERDLVRIFGDKILVHKKHSLDRNNPIAIEDAMIDLYNLSRCKIIYGSFFSSFSDVAALWGRIEKCVLKVEA